MKVRRFEDEMRMVGHTYGAALKRRGSGRLARTSNDNGSLHFFEIDIWRNNSRTWRGGRDNLNGSLRSGMFPGLWLDPQALLQNDLPKLFQAIDRGVATPEHAAFVERLKSK